MDLIRPKRISLFSDVERGICVKCGGTFHLKDMGIVADTWSGVVLKFKLYCKNCFMVLSDGDVQLWEKAGNDDQR